MPHNSHVSQYRQSHFLVVVASSLLHCEVHACARVCTHTHTHTCPPTTWSFTCSCLSSEAPDQVDIHRTPLFHFMFLLRWQLLRSCRLKNSPIRSHPNSRHCVFYRFHLSSLPLPDIFFILIYYLSLPLEYKFYESRDLVLLYLHCLQWPLVHRKYARYV